MERINIAGVSLEMLTAGDGPPSLFSISYTRFLMVYFN